MQFHLGREPSSRCLGAELLLFLLPAVWPSVAGEEYKGWMLKQIPEKIRAKIGFCRKPDVKVKAEDYIFKNRSGGQCVLEDKS